MYRINKSFIEYLTAIKLALTNLSYNKTRTALSILGITIGVLAVIIVVSAGYGLKQFVIGQIEAFGTDIISVEVKIPEVSKTSSQNTTGLTVGAPVTTLKLSDVKTLAKLSNVDSYYALSMAQEIVTFQEENQTSFIMGVTAGFSKVDQQVKIKNGQVFSGGDDEGLAQVIVLGSKIKQDLFGSQQAVGKYVKIQGKSFKVIGELAPRGGAGFFDFDTIIYMPLQTLQKKVLGIDYIQSSVFKLKDTTRMDETVAQMNFEMRRLHDISDPNKDDFAVNTITEATQIIGNIFGAINLLLIALTGISLLVGGVGIMNIMYVSVAERTFEIGLRKAVGASSANIRHQFLFEAVVITLLGSIIGIIVSIIVLLILSRIAFNYGYNVGLAISIQSVILAAVFSIGTGIMFGYYPAKKAAALTPLEALQR